MIADVALAPSGELYTLDDAAVIRFQNPEIGVGYQNVPASQRPAFLWKVIDPPPARVKRIYSAHGGKLLALCENGTLWERLASRDARLIPVFIWKSLSMGEPA